MTWLLDRLVAWLTRNETDDQRALRQIIARQMRTH